jgi:hypothetical protein
MEGIRTWDKDVPYERTGTWRMPVRARRLNGILCYGERPDHSHADGRQSVNPEKIIGPDHVCLACLVELPLCQPDMDGISGSQTGTFSAW